MRSLDSSFKHAGEDEDDEDDDEEEEAQQQRMSRAALQDEDDEEDDEEEGEERIFGWSRWCNADGSFSWAAVQVLSYDSHEETLDVRWLHTRR